MLRIQRCTDRRYCTLYIRMCADHSPAWLARCEQASLLRRTSCMVPPSGDHGIRSGPGEKRAWILFRLSGGTTILCPQPEARRIEGDQCVLRFDQLSFTLIRISYL